MREATVILILLAIVEALLAVLAYLLWAQPRTFFRCCVVERWKTWGVEATLVDERKFRKTARSFGIFVAALAILILGVVLNACALVRGLRR